MIKKRGGGGGGAVRWALFVLLLEFVGKRHHRESSLSQAQEPVNNFFPLFFFVGFSTFLRSKPN